MNSQEREAFAQLAQIATEANMRCAILEQVATSMAKHLGIAADMRQVLLAQHAKAVRENTMPDAYNNILELLDLATLPPVPF